MITVENIEKHLAALGLSGGYLLKDKGQGNFIHKWDHEEIPMPTAEDLAVYDYEIKREKELNIRKKDLKTIGLSDDVENIMDAMLLFDTPMFDAIAEETLDKYRMKKTLKNQ